MITSPTEKLRITQRDHTLIITIDNPAANTWDQDSLDGLESIVVQCNAATDVYALVITGAGEKFFSAGADLNLFADGDKGTAATMAEGFGRAFRSARRLPWGEHRRDQWVRHGWWSRVRACL